MVLTKVKVKVKVAVNGAAVELEARLTMTTIPVLEVRVPSTLFSFYSFIEGPWVILGGGYTQGSYGSGGDNTQSGNYGDGGGGCE